ncbi:MAG: HPr family phosphocarrier protein [Lawsonibacter sp.]
MRQMEVTVRDKDGIHARPAGILAQKMQSFPCKIVIQKGEKEADCKRLFALMKLAIKCGETIILTADGEQEDEAILAAQQIFEENGL